MEQDSLPVSSYYLPREPVEQEVGRKKERAKTLEAKSTLKELIKRLENRIDFYGSVDSIPAAAKADSNRFLTVFNANQLTRDNLRAEKEYIESLLDTAGVTDA